MTADGDAPRPAGGVPDGGEPDGRKPIGRDPGGGDRQDADGADRSGEPDATEADLLRQWEEKIAAIGDPFGALADVLAQGAAQRSTLFQQVGERMLGCDLRTILGAGGMGVTYGGVASDGAPVAVKLVVGVGDSAAMRFAQECRLLRAFDHPAIVRYRDHAVLEDGTGVLVMERVDGVDLEHLLQDVLRDEPPATAAGAELLHEVRGGLASGRAADTDAHAREIRGSDRGRDVADAVVPAVPAAELEPHGVERDVELIVQDDEVVGLDRVEPQERRDGAS